MMPKPGDKVSVETEREKYEGTLLPSSEFEKDIIILKLENGYNIGISKTRIKNISLQEHRATEKKEKGKITQKKGLPKISILHTGGTIASRVDYETGGVIPRFSPEDLLGMFPELKDTANISSRLIRSMFSEDMRFAHYNLLAKEIEKEIRSGAEGVIVTHGTDTLHYTSAALAFILEGLSAPVILVGAQRSSDRGSTDAAANLISAAKFIAGSDFGEVAICMHENESDDSCLILPAMKTRKMHSTRRDAFRPINTTAIARVDYQSGKISFFRKGYALKRKSNISLKPIKDSVKVGLLKIHTNMLSEEFRAYSGWDGLVVEGFGMAGNIPINEIDNETKEHSKVADAIKSLVKNGTVVVATSQTIYGRINMNVYSTGRKMQELGILGNLADMTAETAFIKLAWLLSNYPKEKAKELVTKNLRGEISERIEDRTFLA